MLQNTIAATFASSSSQSCTHQHICQASSLFSISPFGFHPTWISDGNFNWGGKWEDFVFIYTLYPHMVMWPSEKTYGLKLCIDGHDASFQPFTQVNQVLVNGSLCTILTSMYLYSPIVIKVPYFHINIYIYIYYWFFKFWNHRLPLLLLLIDWIGYICILKIKIKIYKM